MGSWTLAGWALVGCAVATALRPLASRLVAPHERGDRLAVLTLPELLAAALTAAVAWQLSSVFEVSAFAVLAAVGVWLGAIDLRFGRLPNPLLAIGYLFTGALLITAATVGGSGAIASLGRAGVGLLATLVAYVTLYLLLPSQLGGGDVKLAGLLGLATGWIGWDALVAAPLLTWFLAALVVLFRRAARRSPGCGTIALGPFLVAGAFAAVILAGSPLTTA